MAQKMLRWRMQNSERLLTHLTVGEKGVYQRKVFGPASKVQEPLGLAPGALAKL